MQSMEPVPDFAPVPPGTAFFLPFQWNIFITQTNLAWGVTLGSSAVKVAVSGPHIDPRAVRGPYPSSQLGGSRS